MIDFARITVKAGDGGRGAGSFRHVKGKRRGKADGGSGGAGGNVYFETSGDLNTLEPYRFVKGYKAQSGGNGLSNLKRGAQGEDLVLKVPVGTEVRLSVLGYHPSTPLRMTLSQSKGQLSDKGQSVSQLTRSVNSGQDGQRKTDKQISGNRQQRTDDWVLYDLVEEGQRVLVARGGEGGRGNAHLRDNFGHRPMSGEGGREGESVNITLELKMIADVGLVGLPNAGKSTLLAKLTAARPEIAPYPFTTLEPNLGVIQLSVVGSLPADASHQAMQAGRLSDDGRSVGQSIGHETDKQKTDKLESENGKLRTDKLVLADIPGLIEGASAGRGLGDLFLRHIERTKLLVHLIDGTEGQEGREGQEGSEGVEGLLKNYMVVRGELKAYSMTLAKKKEIIVLNKADLVSGEKVRLAKEIFSARRKKVFVISAVSGEGLPELVAEIVRRLR